MHQIRPIAANIDRMQLITVSTRAVTQKNSKWIPISPLWTTWEENTSPSKSKVGDFIDDLPYATVEEKEEESSDSDGHGSETSSASEEEEESEDEDDEAGGYQECTKLDLSTSHAWEIGN